MEQTPNRFIQVLQTLLQILMLVGLSLGAGLLTGCTSMTERAEDLMSEGRVDEALKLATDARVGSPNSDTYIQLERRVRLQWIADKLIQARLARLAENQGASSEIMRTVLKNETEWGLIPTGAVFATQAEESGYLAQDIQFTIRDSIRKKQPLAAVARYRTDRVLIEDLLKLDTTKLKLEIAAASREFCLKESARLTKQDHYSALFLARTCKELGVIAKTPKTINSVKLFGKLEPEMEVFKIPGESTSVLSKNLREEFEKSIWHDGSSKTTLGLKVTGAVEEKVDTRKAYRSKPYTVRVPYEETSVRKKEQKAGIVTLFEVLAWALSTYQPNREVDNGDGTVTVYETKYREETRYFNYEAEEVTQNLALDWKIALTPQGKPYEFRFQDRLKTTSDEHTISFPDAGLQPETRKLVRPADWLVSINRNLMDRIGDEFHRAWIEQFCSESSLEGSLKTELQNRCIYGANGLAPSSTKDWFSKRYGIEIETWRRLVAMSK